MKQKTRFVKFGNISYRPQKNHISRSLAGSVPSTHSQGQALVGPLSLLGVTRHVNKFICKVSPEGGSGLTIHTNGFDCNWLKMVIVEVITFSVFCSLSLCCYSACLSSAVFVMALSKSAYNCCVLYQA